MGWIDNIVGAISPESAYKREAYRQAWEALRNYDAGGYNRPNQNWRVFNQSAEATDRYDRGNVMARARDLERNSDIMNSVVGAYKRNVVGGGFHVQAKTGEEDINKQLEDYWREWSKKRNCDVTGTQNLNQILRMAVQRKKIDGGILFVKVYTSGGIVPFKLQMIEVDELDGDVMTPMKKGNKVIGGIEYNTYNKAVGYWIKRYAPDGVTNINPVYVDEQNVIFYFTKRRPSQLREMSDVAPSIPRIRDVNEFMMAVAVKQRIEACLSVFIKKAIPTTGIGRGNAPANEKAISYEGKTISPGIIKELNVGDEIAVRLDPLSHRCVLKTNGNGDMHMAVDNAGHDEFAAQVLYLAFVALQASFIAHIHKFAVLYHQGRRHGLVLIRSKNFCVFDNLVCFHGYAFNVY